MNIKRIYSLIIGSLVLIGFTFSAQAQTQGVYKDRIIIGTHTAVSGPAAAWGVPSTNAIRMRFDEANEKGGIHGREIVYIVEDTQYQVPLAVQKGNKLINRDKAFALIANMGAAHNRAVFKTQEKKNVPNLFPFSLDRSVIGSFHRLTFGMASTYYDQVRGGLKYFVEKKGKKRVCAMVIGSDYGTEVLKGVNDQLHAMNMKLIAYTKHKMTDTSFVTPITKLQKAKCDLILLGSNIRDTILPMGTARKMAWNVDFIGLSTSGTAATITHGKGAVEGLYVSTGFEVMYEDEATDPRAIAFFKNYKKRFIKKDVDVNNTAYVVAETAYTIADIVVLALEKAGKDLTVDSFIKALESIKGYKAMFGGPDRNFSSTNHKPFDQSRLIQIKNGRFVSPTGENEILDY